MQKLKERILQDGIALNHEVLKVDSFLNHQIDVNLLNEIGKAFYSCFEKDNVSKILTVEASGIGIACICAQYFNVPVVFAKKTQSRNLDQETYESEVYSFTKQISYRIKVSKKYLSKEDRILIIDDFLANGQALLGLNEIVEESKATLVGAGIVIEKAFQQGGAKVRERGIRVESLAIIEKMAKDYIQFKEETS